MRVLKAGTPLDGITVVSAYTDPILIEELLVEIGSADASKKIVRICLDFGASGYHRDKRITDHLDELARILSTSFHKTSGIFLINLGRLMHTKILILHVKQRKTVMVGSPNFTRRGFFTNEEILTTVDRNDEPAVHEYAEQLFADVSIAKVPFEGIGYGVAATSNREWLLNGALFFEDKAASPYNFKLGLPSGLLRQPAIIVPGMEAEEPDNVSLMRVLEITPSKNSLRWKRYCVQTCYGHWCPSQLVEVARRDIATATADKRESKIGPVVKHEDLLKEKFMRVFIEIDPNIKKFNKERGSRHKWKKEQAVSRLEKWLPRTIAKLKDEENLRRLLAGVNETIIPDFWAGDEIALREFEESFCSHIVLELSKARVQNWVALCCMILSTRKTWHYAMIGKVI